MLEKTEVEVNEQKQDKVFTRRKVLGVGAAAVGAIAAGGLLTQALSGEIVNVEINGKIVKGDVPATILNGRTLVPIRLVSENLGAKVDWVASSKTVKITSAPSAGNAPAPALPWKYQKLDVEAVRKAGYDFYKIGGCCYGSAAALLKELGKTPGSFYGTIPIDMFGYGEGGAYGWGTLCGALNGALAVMNIAAGKNADLGSTLMGWYQENPFPSNKHEAYTTHKNQVSSVSKSPLCHASVTTWCKVANAKVSSAERKERCAKLTGDTAAYVAELLNAKLEAKPDPKFAATSDYISCLGCHNGATSVLDNEQGKMNCTPCHTDHIKK